MSLDDMAREIRVSKGSVSTNMRELEKWGAVRQVWVKGDRKDYYEAEVDLLMVIKSGILPFLKKKVNSSLIAASESRSLIREDDHLQDKDKSLADFYSRRLDLIEKAQNRLSVLLDIPGI